MPRRGFKGFLVALLAFVWPLSADASDWHHSALADHPLIGKIWSTRTQQFVTAEDVAAAVRRARYVLLGEKHDNRDHHRLQAKLARTVYATGRRPDLAFEMIETDKQPVIDAYLSEGHSDAGRLGERIEWKRSGWPDWSNYQPIADAAVAAGATVVAANLPRKNNRGVARQGFAVLGQDLVGKSGLDKPFPEVLQKELEDEIVVSHCNQIPPNAVPAIARVQRARDAVMSERMVYGGSRDGAVLITGAGHARLDRGVPFYLRIIDPDGTVVSVGFREVSHDATDIAAYEDADKFDFVWFTPRVDTNDPCEQFKKQLEKMKKKAE